MQGGEPCTSRQAVPEAIRVALFAIVCAYVTLLAVALYQHQWLIRGNGRYVATDFVAFWAAARLAVQGQAVAAWDWVAHDAVAISGVGPFVSRYPWLYPPTFLLVVGPFGLAPYPVAMLAWIGATLTGYLVAVRAIVERPIAMLATLAFPAVLINIVTGQAGFLTAGLLGGGLALLQRHPGLAGILFGFLTVKPQLGILIPVALATGGYWGVFGFAFVSAASLAILSVLLFGVESWIAFIGSVTHTAEAVLQTGEMGFGKMQSIYGVVRALGWGDAVGGSVQGTVGVICAMGLWLLWRSDKAYELKAAALATGAIMAQPYVFIYDSAFLGVALAFLVRLALRTGFLPIEAAGFFAVGVALLLAFASVPHAGLAATLLMGLVLVRRLALSDEVAISPVGETAKGLVATQGHAA